MIERALDQILEDATLDDNYELARLIEESEAKLKMNDLSGQLNTDQIYQKSLEQITCQQKVCMLLHAIRLRGECLINRKTEIMRDLAEVRQKRQKFDDLHRISNSLDSQSEWVIEEYEKSLEKLIEESVSLLQNLKRIQLAIASKAGLQPDNILEELINKIQGDKQTLQQTIQTSTDESHTLFETKQRLKDTQDELKQGKALIADLREALPIKNSELFELQRKFEVAKAELAEAQAKYQDESELERLLKEEAISQSTKDQVLLSLIQKSIEQSPQLPVISEPIRKP